MKIRNGFVSNSSSSSFIIGCSGDLTKEKLLEALKVPFESPLYGFVGTVADYIVTNAKKFSKQGYLEWVGMEGVDGWDIPKDIQDIFNKGMTLYIGDASNDGDYLENMICGLDLQIKSENMVLLKEGY